MPSFRGIHEGRDKPRGELLSARAFPGIRRSVTGVTVVVDGQQRTTEVQDY